MEPFGLFQFLQSLLKTPPAQDAQEEVKPQEEAPPNPPVSEPSNTANNEAYLQFITNHEQRARGIRKK